MNNRRILVVGAGGLGCLIADRMLQELRKMEESGQVVVMTEAEYATKQGGGFTSFETCLSANAYPSSLKKMNANLPWYRSFERNRGNRHW